MKREYNEYPSTIEGCAYVNDYFMDYLKYEERYALLFLYYYQKEEGMGLYDLLHEQRCPEPLINETIEMFSGLLPKMKEAFVKFVGPEGTPDNLFEFYWLEFVDLLDFSDDYMLEGFFDRYYARSPHRIQNPVRLMVQEHLEPVTFWESCLVMFAGYGDVTNDLFKEGTRRIDSLTVDPVYHLFTKMRFYVLKHHLEEQGTEERLDNTIFINKDPFRFSLSNHKAKYDRIFAQFPWGHVPDLTAGEFKQLWQGTVFADLKMDIKSDWKYLALAIKHMTPDGRACLLAPISLEYKQMDEEIREFFIREGYIEKVIRLPHNMKSGESGASLFVVLSHGNTGIEFDEYDLSDIALGRRFQSSLRHGNDFNPMDPKSGVFIDQEGNMYESLCGGIRLTDILSDYKAKKDREVYGPKNLKYKSNQEVLDAKRLDPRYFLIPEVTNGKPLDELADIIRGTSLTKKFLDENLYPEVTGIELLRLSNIQSGLVTSHHFIKKMPDNPKLLQPGDILITRVTSHIDMLIYDGRPKDQVLVDENFFVVRSKGSVDPYYLFAYLKSDLGREQLMANFRGTQISKLRTQDLKKLLIPIVESQDQESIVATTKDSQRKIKDLVLELQMAMEQMQEESNYSFQNKWMNEKNN